MKAVVIGGGIIGLSCAYYLQKSGWHVTVVDKSDLSDSCSYGNLGIIVPSHFVQLPLPCDGIPGIPLAKMADVSLSLVLGKGYSFTLVKPEQNLNIPANLCEARVAIRPMNGMMRYGDTMEIGK